MSADPRPAGVLEAALEEVFGSSGAAGGCAAFLLGAVLLVVVLPMFMCSMTIRDVAGDYLMSESQRCGKACASGRMRGSLGCECLKAPHAD